MSWMMALYPVWEMVSKKTLFISMIKLLPPPPPTPTMLPALKSRKAGRLGGCWVVRRHTWRWQRNTGPASGPHSSGRCRSAPFPWLPLVPPLQEAGHWGLQSETSKSSVYTPLCSSGTFWPEGLVPSGQPRSVYSSSSPTTQHFHTHSEQGISPKAITCVFSWTESQL